MTVEEFVAARLGALMRYATVVSCDPDLVQDVVQEVLLRAHPQWPRIGAMAAPEQYLRRMVLNEFLTWRIVAALVVVPGLWSGGSSATPLVSAAASTTLLCQSLVWNSSPRSRRGVPNQALTPVASRTGEPRRPGSSAALP